MDLYREILTNILEKEEITVVFQNLQLNPAEMVEQRCCQALHKIKTIIEDDSLSDFDCVEKIVCILEDIGSSGGNRHDF